METNPSMIYFKLITFYVKTQNTYTFFYQVNINKNFLCRVRMTSPHRRYISHLHLHMSTLKVTLTSTQPGMSFISSTLNGYYISFCTLFIYLCYISIPLMCLLIKILKYCLKCLLVTF